MIFITVGQQIGFDRLVHAVDAWAEKAGRTDVFAQIHDGRPPRFIKWARFITPDDFRKRVIEADVVVAHAGMGAIITALGAAKPIIVMPRRGHLGETRNDHQVATVQRFAGRTGIIPAMDEHELTARLDAIDRAEKGAIAPPRTSDELITVLRAFVNAPPGRKPAIRTAGLETT